MGRGKEFGLLFTIATGMILTACNSGDKPETNAAGLPVDTTPVPGHVIELPSEPATPTPYPTTMPTLAPVRPCLEVGIGQSVYDLAVRLHEEEGVDEVDVIFPNNDRLNDVRYDNDSLKSYSAEGYGACPSRN